MSSNHRTVRSAAAGMGAVAFLALLAPCAPAQVLTRTWTGADGDRLGSVAPAGDVNGDGFPDLVLGYPGIVPDGGRVEVRSGADSSVLLTLRAADVNPFYPGLIQWIGFAVAGDIDDDGDGYADLLLGDPRNEFSEFGTSGPNCGFWCIYSPHLGRLLTWTSGRLGHELGYAVASLPDLDGNGWRDWAVGAPGDDRILIHFTGNGSDGILGTQSGSRFGSAIAVTNSGLSHAGFLDVAIGAPGWDDPGLVDCGRVQIFTTDYGDAHLGDLVGTRPKSHFGKSLAALEDANGDGFLDLAVGAPFADDPSRGFTNEGCVTVFSDFLTYATEWHGGDSSVHLGYSVANVGDQNQDGIDDLAIGLPGSGSTIGAGHGQVFVVSGADAGSGAYGTLLRTYGPSHASGGTDLGYGIALASGDFDHDGWAEMLVGDHDWHVETGNGLVDCWEAAPAHVFDYGTGWPGELGEPSLDFPLPPEVGSWFDLSFRSSSSSKQIALLFLGVSPATLQLKSGATLLVKPVESLLFDLPPQGETFSFEIEDDPSLYGVDLYVQGVMTDPFAKGRLSFTSGAQIHLGYDDP